MCLRNLIIRGHRRCISDVTTRCKWQSVSADRLCLDHLEQMLIPEVNRGKTRVGLMS